MNDYLQFLTVFYHRLSGHQIRTHMALEHVWSDGTQLAEKEARRDISKALGE